MVGYEEALKIAKSNYPEVDNFEEYEKAFVFGNSKENSFGGPSPIVIDKSSGEALMFVAAIGDGLLDDDPVREGQI